MNTITLFGMVFELYQVVSVAILLTLAIILLTVTIILLIKFIKYRSYSIECEKIIQTEEIEDELEEKLELEDTNEKENALDAKKKTCPRRLNLRLRLINATDNLKKRYSTIRNLLENYKIHERFLKHRDIYYITKEIVKRDEDNSISNEIVIYKLAMMTIRSKQLILSLNVEHDLTDDEKEKNIIINSRRYSGYNFNMKVSTEADLEKGLTLVKEILEKNSIPMKKRHKEVDYVKEFTSNLSTFERRGYGYLLRNEVTLEEVDEYTNSISKKAIVINKIDEKPLDEDVVTLSLDTLQENFDDGDEINISKLKEKGILGSKCVKYAVNEGKYLNKKFFIDADRFSSNAIKMIFFVGGEARIIQRIAK